MKKQVCILTKSLKDDEYCVAGIDLETKDFIRLVTTPQGGAFTKELLDDRKIKELDLIEIEVSEKVPYNNQKENWLIKKNCEIKKIQTLTKSQMLNIKNVDSPETIFGNKENELESKEAKNLDHSIEMLKVRNLEFDTSMKGDGRHHYKVQFEYNKNSYNLALTDPKFRNEDYDHVCVPNSTIVVSLPAKPYGENNLYYKFVAKIFI